MLLTVVTQHGDVLNAMCCVCKRGYHGKFHVLCILPQIHFFFILKPTGRYLFAPHQNQKLKRPPKPSVRANTGTTGTPYTTVEFKLAQSLQKTTWH